MVQLHSDFLSKKGKMWTSNCEYEKGKHISEIFSNGIESRDDFSSSSIAFFIFLIWKVLKKLWVGISYALIKIIILIFQPQNDPIIKLREKNRANELDFFNFHLEMVFQENKFFPIGN